MPSGHELFKALGPVDWESFAQEDPTILMKDIFNDARCLIGSIPNPFEDGSLSSEPVESGQLSREWKEVKVNPRDNTLGLGLYKLAARDGRGAWFARRSVHDGQSFKKWKTGMEREFAESLKVQGQPGSGKIRGLGADKCVVDQSIEGWGKIQVYQLSAQFPGPTTPRDFVTLCLSSDTTITTPTPKKPGRPRSFMLVSKPCVHPECPARQGFIRGYYESVELIREIKVEKVLHETPLSADATNKVPSSSTTSGSKNVSKESVVSNSIENDQNGDSKSSEHESHEEDNSIIEWVMITRSDPGGSVPRFMIEKKTPEGIATDANKFFQWVSSEKFEMLLDKNYESSPAEAKTAPGVTAVSITSGPLSSSISTSANDAQAKLSLGIAEQDKPEYARSPGPGGVYGMISGALGMVASAAASRLLGSTGGDETESEISTPDVSDGSSSIHSFHSFDGTGDTEPRTKTAEGEEPARSVSTSAGGDSLNLALSPQHDKELRKIEERRRKAEDKLRRAEERATAKRNDDAQRDQLALQKLREKYERGVAKQEAKYQRERSKLEAKRAAEERKAEERRRKQLEREDKANLALELDRTRAERDVALQEIETLTEQVKQYQGLNTKLVARLYREGVDLDELPPSPASGGLAPGGLSRSVTEQDLGSKSSSVKS